MKNANKIFWAVTIMFLINLVSISNLSAQCFTSAIISDNSYNTSSSSYFINTGNDVNQQIHVWVYDGGTPELAWKVATNATNSIALQNSDAFDPDVVLVKDMSNVWWALVVYYSPSAGHHYVCEQYKYVGTSFVYGTTFQLENVSNFGTAINIDANADGDFVIVWDKSTGISMNYGSIANSGVTFHNGQNSPISLYSNNEHMPDVAIYSDISYNYIFYTYVDASGSYVNVDEAEFSAPQTLTTDFTEAYTDICSYCNGYVAYPRIACPAPLNLADYRYFTVVYELNFK